MAIGAKDVLKVFQRWDSDGKGVLSSDDFRVVLHEIGFLPETVVGILSVASLNRDGKVNYTDFVKWVFSDGSPEVVSPVSGCDPQLALITITIVSAMSGGTLASVGVEQDWSVLVVKQAAEKEAHDGFVKNMFLNDRLLEDSETVQGLGLTNGSVLHVVLGGFSGTFTRCEPYWDFASYMGGRGCDSLREAKWCVNLHENFTWDATFEERWYWGGRTHVVQKGAYRFCQRVEDCGLRLQLLYPDDVSRSHEATLYEEGCKNNKRLFITWTAEQETPQELRESVTEDDRQRYIDALSFGSKGDHKKEFWTAPDTSMFRVTESQNPFGGEAFLEDSD